MTQDAAAARCYAQAFVNLAHPQGALERGIHDVAAFGQIMDTQPSLGRLLANPGVSPNEKCGVLSRLLDGRVAPLTLRFLQLLIRKGRMPLLPTIVAEARSLRDQVEGIARGVVRSAHALPGNLLASLQTRLERRLGSRLILSSTVDPALLGGVTVQIGNTLFDGSLRRELEQLREQLTSPTVGSS